MPLTLSPSLGDFWGRLEHNIMLVYRSCLPSWRAKPLENSSSLRACCYILLYCIIIIITSILLLLLRLSSAYSYLK